MKKLLSDKDSSFDITHVREEESDSKNVKRDTRYMWKPQERDEKTRFEQELNVLAMLKFVLYEEKRSLLSVRVFFLKEIPYFLHFYLINFLLSSSNIYLGSYLKIQLHVPLII